MEAVDGQDAEHQVVQRQDHRFGAAHGIALILLAATMAFAPAAKAQFGFRGFVAIYVLAALLWLTLRRATASIAVVLAVGLGLRVMFLVAEPTLSGDVYRYLSDGRRLASGHNPYTYTPDDPRINHPEIRSIYPPLAQLVFMLFEQPHLGLFGKPNGGVAMIVWKVMLILGDLGAIVMLHRYRLSSRASSEGPGREGREDRVGRPTRPGPSLDARDDKGGSLALAFATCPLVIFEGAWNGHLDALAAVFLGLALAKRSGFAAAIAAGLKVIPLAAVPVLFPKRRPFSFYFALLFPFYFFLGGPIMPGFRDYATRWIFNSPLYALIHAIVERIPTKAIWTHHPLRFAAISDVVYRHLDPDFMTRAILATMAIGGILLARRATTAVAALLLCSPAIHPWYWLTLVPTALMERSPWILVALCAPFSYLLYDHAPPLLVFALCYAIPLVRLWRD